MTSQMDAKIASLKLILFLSLLFVVFSLYGLVYSHSELDVLVAILFGLLGIYLELFVIAYKYLSKDKA